MTTRKNYNYKNNKTYKFIVFICVLAVSLFTYMADKKDVVSIPVDEEVAIDAELTRDNAINKTYGPYVVSRVVDGDTYIINLNGRDEKVRLIGVDTPESVARGSNAEKNCEEGKTASNYVKQLIERESVYLEYDIQERDRYGRILAYVYLNDGTQLEEVLLNRGYARVMTISPNVAYADRYVELQKKARRNNTGFWESNPWNE